ncbi:Beta-lactamase superfamily domain protein [Legionella nautarum]|uniref:Beta-lactamase superfamily domain protein n=1 Tax=Legionella nautarum TaxID=45070 RepID=A0A0W0WU29_9GAMM|nr:ligase-associated DNA damage response exonuclease [Legionella nautarum]KTD35821.1 Beta-lactamase superfamily domain protein [Legionella nautarum]
MPKLSDWLIPKPAGLFCVPGGFFIDPIGCVERAVITHAHNDHARPGHDKVLATPETIAIMQLRLGNQSCSQWQNLPYHQSIKINQVKLSFIPAGHILGSSQVVIEYGKQRLIISGDYKRVYDPTCRAFEARVCDFFVTEATFGLPIFKHPPIEDELKKLLVSVEKSPLCHMIAVYPLGKCQRVIKTLRQLNYCAPIYVHGALLNLCQLYESYGIQLGELRSALSLDKQSAKKKIVLCPPGELHSRWTRRFGEMIRANASGWMQIRARAKQKNIDLPLIVSDHADWFELLQTIEEVNPEEIWVTHGLEDALVHAAKLKGFKAKALRLLGKEERED